MAINNTYISGLTGGSSTAPGQGVVNGQKVSVPTAKTGLVNSNLSVSSPTSNLIGGPVTLGVGKDLINTPQGATSIFPAGTPSANTVAANTYSGGVNGLGQTFPGLVNALGNTASQPSQNFTQNMDTSQQAQTGLINSIPGNSQAVQDATNNLKTLQDNYQDQTGIIGNSPIGLSEQGGEQGLLNTQYAGKLANAQGALTNALANNAQTQAAFNEAGGLANTAAGASTGQQSTQQSGLGTAAGLVQPQLGQYGQTQYSPLNAGQDSTNSGGALNPINNIQSLAQQVISGQISPSQAYAMGGSVANFQGALNAAIQQVNPGFNTAAAQGKYDANQSNTTTAGTTPTNAAASLYASTYPQLAQIQTATSNIDQLGSLLVNNMQSLNPSAFQAGNQTIAAFRSALSSPQQAQFDTTFAQLKAQIASLLSTGGSQVPTQTTADANAIISGNAPVGTIAATLQRIKQEGNILTQGLQGQLNTGGSVIGAPKSGSNNNPAGI